VQKKDLQTDNLGKFGTKAEFGSLWMGRRSFLQKIVDKREKNELLDETFQNFKEDRWLYREIRMLGRDTYRSHNLRVTHFGNLSVSKIPKEVRLKQNEENIKHFEDLKKQHNIE
jgi:hypothetical protein